MKKFEDSSIKMKYFYRVYFFLIIFLHSCNNGATSGDDWNEKAHVVDQLSQCYQNLFFYPAELDSPIFTQVFRIAMENGKNLNTYHVDSFSNYHQWEQIIFTSQCQWNVFLLYDAYPQDWEISKSKIHLITSLNLNQSSQEFLKTEFKEKYLDLESFIQENSFTNGIESLFNTDIVLYFLKFFEESTFKSIVKPINTIYLQGKSIPTGNLEVNVYDVENNNLDKKEVIDLNKGYFKGVALSRKNIVSIKIKTTEYDAKGYYWMIHPLYSFPFLKLIPKEENKKEIVLYFLGSRLQVKNLDVILHTIIPLSQFSEDILEQTVSKLTLSKMKKTSFDPKYHHLILNNPNNKSLKIKLFNRTFTIQNSSVVYWFQEAKKDTS